MNVVSSEPISADRRLGRLGYSGKKWNDFRGVSLRFFVIEQKPIR